MPLRIEHSPMSAAPFILTEISGSAPSVSVKEMLESEGNVVS